jgi:hypothetical protein
LLPRGTFVIGTRSFLSVMHIERQFRNNTITILVLLLTLTSGLFLATRTVLRANAVTTPATFSNFELAGNPFVFGYGVGQVCPTSPNCVNTEGEPQIRADKSGNFYASSENRFCVVGGLCGGTFAWRSTDGGQHFTTSPLPNSFSECGTAYQPIGDVCQSNPARRIGYSPAGGDTDIAVAPRKNANGFYNVYVASLASATSGLVNIFVSTSQDGGRTWSLPNFVSALPFDDREWIAAYGASKVCLSYHDVAATNHVFVSCSSDAGQTFTQPGDGFDAAHQYFGGFNNIGGNIVIDPRNGVVYDIIGSISANPAQAALDATCDVTSDCLHALWVAVSLNGGKTFTDHLIYENPSPTTTYDHQFPSIAVDRSGVVYAAFTDNTNTYYSFSTDFGNTWSSPRQVNSGPANTAIFPWITAGNGAVDIVYYGSSYVKAGVVPDVFPPDASWYVYFAQNLQADTTTSTFTQVQASASIIHYGPVCESGATCNGNRDLLDDFGVAASPTTGLAAIIYTDDQFTNTPNEPTGPRCTPDLNNDVHCGHTNIAVQTSGPGVNQHPHDFEVDEEDLENTDLKGGNAPDFRIHGEDMGRTAITSISVQVSGLPVTFTWTNTFPLSIGQAATAETRTLPLGLVLAVGSIYSVTITATRADGTTETQTAIL